MDSQLMQIEHIVVLMLENRSFDHMLGYLRLESGRTDIDGLTGNEINYYQGIPYNPQRMLSTTLSPDPCHDWHCVQQQLAHGNSGFIQNYATRAGKPTQPELVMNYYNAQDLPVFDHLANQFCVCDRWFSSLPGPTHPTRAYALAGESAGTKENSRAPAGIFNIPTIFDLLPDTVTWRYYSHDIAFLRSFDKYLLDLGPIDKVESFYEAARAGELPNVCWIDPNFGIFYREDANDDHPPTDIRRGQNLVSMIYNALLTASNNQWQKTLFIVLYDEHGGFYDHVDPTQWTPQDDRPEFQRYGVRVPALVISPWVSRRVAYGSQSHHLQSEHVVFDHTSILKTILRRFCVLPSGRIPHLTMRVDAANDLSGLLTEDQPRTDCTPTPAVPYRARPIDRMWRFGVEPPAVRKFSDLQESLRALSDVAVNRGVPLDKL